MVLSGELDKVQVKMDDGTVGTITLTKKGSVKIQRSKTIQDAAEG